MSEADAYLAVYERLTLLMKDRVGDEILSSCPGWTVRDAVAHMTGLCEDWVEGRLDGYASDEWTAGQVARFSRHSLPEILSRWAETIDVFMDLPDDPTMGPPGRWGFGDAVVHEADIRGALGVARVPLDAVDGERS